MKFVHIVTFKNADANARISDSDFALVKEIVASLEGLTHTKYHTASAAKDKYTDDGHSPQLVIEMYYRDLAILERNIAVDGRLQALALSVGDLMSLRGVEIEHQVMISRPFPVLDAIDTVQAPQCSYLVHYPGYAEDFPSWLNYYLEHHPQIMKFFPGIREIEIYTCIDWLDRMPWKRVRYMQRNKLVFDTPADLEKALNSSVRDDMRKDFESFPTFHGSNRHFAMLTTTKAGTA
jgi:hypothetical protein